MYGKIEKRVGAKKNMFPQIGAIELEDDVGFNEEQALQKVCLYILPRKKNNSMNFF